MTGVESGLAMVSRALNEGRLAVFAGAGISRASGLPLAQELTREILTNLNVSVEHIARIIEAALPFELFFQVLRDMAGEDNDMLVDIFRGSHPSRTHHLLARLCATGALPSIVTTNFDQLIEAAFGDIEGTSRKLVVCADDSTERPAEADAGRSRLIKLHGSLDDPSAMAITLRQVAEHMLAENRRQLLSNVIRQTKVLLVLGYSCSDAFDISPALEELAGPDCKVVLIDHAANTNRVAAIPQKPDPNPFRNYDGLWIQTDTDTFIAEVWRRHLGEPAPPLWQAERTWPAVVARWGSRARQRNQAVGLLIAAHMFMDAGDFERYCECGKLGLERATSAVARLSWHGNLGNAYSALGRSEEAYQHFNDARSIAEETGDHLRLMMIESGLGSLSLERRRNADAAEHFERALVLSAELQDEARANIYSTNAASAHVLLGNWDRAHELLESAFSWSQENGDPHGLEHVMGLRGQYHNLRGDHPGAIDHLKRAIEMARILGERRHVGTWFKNLGDVYRAIGDEPSARAAYAQAVENLEEALGRDHEDVNEVRELLRRV